MQTNPIRSCCSFPLIAALLFGTVFTSVSAQQGNVPQPKPTKGTNVQQGKQNVPELKTVNTNVTATGKETIPEVLAEVNGEKITKEQVMQETFRQHYEEILDNRIRTFLIELECRRTGITITPEEENAEIQKMAKTFGFTSDDWFDALLKERNLDPATYRSEILRPILAIRKLAGQRVQVSEEEIGKEYEAAYGPSIQVRQIVHNSRQTLEEIRNRVVANPASFAKEAKDNSLDPSSAAYGGMIQPIRRYATNEVIEKAVLNLQPKEISAIVEFPRENFILFQCEQHFPALNVNEKNVRDALVFQIQDRKTRGAADDVFRELQNKAQIQVVLKDPTLSQQHPKIAAFVNGAEITRLEVAQRCFKQYGEQILAERISILVLEQECKRRNITITDQELDAEIVERATLELPLKLDGTPNTVYWLEVQAKNQNVPVMTIRNNTVRPLIMLKKLAQDQVQVTEEDIQKGFEANHGPRVRCLAIFQDNMRRAQQVWAEANNVRDPAYFGDLAEKYSVNDMSRALRGEIPPIQKYGGMPQLEEAAFQLEPGELSEVIQLGPEMYAILFCLGQTKPVVMDINDVRGLLEQDLKEKKTQLAMQDYLEKTYKRSTISNYLTGETNEPKSPNELQEAGNPMRQKR